MNKNPLFHTGPDNNSIKMVFRKDLLEKYFHLYLPHSWERDYDLEIARKLTIAQYYAPKYKPREGGIHPNITAQLAIITTDHPIETIMGIMLKLNEELENWLPQPLYGATSNGVLGRRQEGSCTVNGIQYYVNSIYVCHNNDDYTKTLLSITGLCCVDDDDADDNYRTIVNALDEFFYEPNTKPPPPTPQ